MAISGKKKDKACEDAILDEYQELNPEKYNISPELASLLNANSSKDRNSAQKPTLSSDDFPEPVSDTKETSTNPAASVQTEADQGNTENHKINESSDQPDKNKNKKKNGLFRKNKNKKENDFSDLLSDDISHDETSENKSDNKKSEKKNKKRKNKKHVTPFILLGILIFITAFCIGNILHCQNNFDVNFYQIESLHVSSDIRIVVISDVHLNEFGEDNKTLVDSVKALHPDLIISAGDLVSYGVKDYDNMLSLCEQLCEIAPMYGITGNHEDEKLYLEGDESIRDKFKATGMKLLINKTEKIAIKNNKIELVGITGYLDGFDLYGGKKAMDSLDPSSTALRICIAHVPTLFTERLDDYEFDIGIAGHTHGGIIRVPVVGGLYSAEEGFLPEFDGGLYKLDNGATLFVSRGLGNSGKIPRFNNTPELAVLDIKWY